MNIISEYIQNKLQSMLRTFEPSTNLCIHVFQNIYEFSI